MPVQILYSDNELIVCVKPVGISSESPGLPDLIQKQTGKKAYPVHRLDQGTGGVIILSFSSEFSSEMQSLFQKNQIRKEYLAVISGKPSESSGSYIDLLFHDKHLNKTFVVKRLRKGVKEACCDWTLIQSVLFDNRIYSLVRIRLHTGRTHQIRIQFASRGMPLYGDRKYGSKSGSIPSLWSYSVGFTYPKEKRQPLILTSLPPNLFPWNLFSLNEL